MATRRFWAETVDPDRPTRWYPSCCTSAYCAGTQAIDCPTCPHDSVRLAFDQWCTDHAAIRPNRDSLMYQATR